MEKIVYIAGPMRGYPKFNFPAFDEAAARFRAAGYTVISPAEIDRENEPETETLTVEQVSTPEMLRIYAKRDTEALMKCTHIAMLPGWEKSTGATAELHFARWIKLTILDATTMEPAVRPPAEIRNGDFVVKDTGERTKFSTGAQRDAARGKGFFHCIPFVAIEALAKLYEAGAEKYGKHNWKKGIPLSRYIDGMERHAMKLAEAWVDEDHAAAVIWNAAGFIWTVNELRMGRLPMELDDIGYCAARAA